MRGLWKVFGGARIRSFCIALRTNRNDFPPTVIVKGCFEPYGKGMIGLQIAEAKYYEVARSADRPA